MWQPSSNVPFWCPLLPRSRLAFRPFSRIWIWPMRQHARVTFAMCVLNRLKCIQAVIDEVLKPIKAANRLGLPTRQVRRLARGYLAQGPAGMISKRFNRRSNELTTTSLIAKVLRSTYPDFGPTSAAEKLRTKHGIDLVGHIAESIT